MQLVHCSKIAELAGVSRAAISKAAKGKLAPACVGKLKLLRVDLDHPIVVAYIDERRNSPTPQQKQKSSIATSATHSGAPDGNYVTSLVNESGKVLDLEDLTVREIALRYGGAAGFGVYVKALKDIADYKNKEQLHLIKSGELIERATTAAALFMLIDVAFNRLVVEMPDAIIQQLIPLAQSAGADAEKEGRALLISSVSKILKGCKSEVRKKLRALDKSGEAG